MWHLEGFSVSRLHWIGDCFEVVHYVGPKDCIYLYWAGMYTIPVFIDIKNLLTISYLWAVFTHYLVVTNCRSQSCLGLQVQI